MKHLLQQLFLVLTWLPVLLVKASGRVCDRDDLLVGYAQLLSLVPGKLGSYARAASYSQLMAHCSQNVYIGFGTLFSQTDTTIEAGVYIGPQCNIGSASLGRDCLLGSGVHVLSGKQQHTIDNIDKPIREQGGKLTKIRIGENTWVGNGALIMAHVGRQCVIGAGSVVVNDIPDRCIAAGNPARVIRERESGAEHSERDEAA